MNSASDSQAPSYPPTAPQSPLHFKQLAKWTFLIVFFGWVFTLPILYNGGRYGVLVVMIVVLTT